MSNVVCASISVRNLVEFVLRSGDIDNSSSHFDFDAMQEGTRIHKKLQKAAPVGYTAEVALKKTFVFERDEDVLELTIDGRADGILTETLPDGAKVTIDEIKCTYLSSDHIEPAFIHEAQAKCYAAIYGEEEALDEITVQLTYCNIYTEDVVRFANVHKVDDLTAWLKGVVTEYSKWLFWEIEWKRKRNETIKRLTFPFAYREGQRELVSSVYKSILRGKKLFIEAPTGVGKTISTVFPAIWSVGEGKSSKIFYLTAKTIARTVAEDTFSMLSGKGLKFRFVTITSKEKSCILDSPSCNPSSCPRAKGHFDRINDCVFDMLNNEETIDRDIVFSYAEKYCVCPFEMCLDVSLWADAIICDYNYAFDPRASLKRYFADEKKNDYVFLIDEAHNLLERAREMYSAELVKEDFLKVKRALEGRNRKMTNCLEACNKVMLAMKHECEEFQVWDDAEELFTKVQRLASAYEDFLEEGGIPEETRDDILDLFFSIRSFITVYNDIDDSYRIYSDFLPNGNFRVKLLCMEPAGQLKQRLDNTQSSVLFSATLLPMDYYKEQLGGEADDYAIYAPSPFKPEKRLVMVAGDVTTRYSKRSADEYMKVAGYIERFVSVKTGNYMVFFSSYKMLEDVVDIWGENPPAKLLVQRRDMTESDKEEFLGSFVNEPHETLIGLCVMGGIFSEGIDLTGDRLTGAVVVGCGLPTVGYERELFKFYFDEKNDKGFEYAYLYPGMNKVMQSAGRVIRTVTDVGMILLLDERFTKRQYNSLFPREWFPYENVTLNTVKTKAEEFFNGQ